jgi:anti-sigma factor RsiW
MTRCLDEAKLQSYFDGELSLEMIESVTSHLASCVTCAAAAREIEEESALLTSALAAEIETSVPTERLRERLDAVILGDRLALAQSTQKSSGLAAFFSGLLSFGTQRTLRYASVAVLLAFAVIAAAVKMRTTTTVPPANSTVAQSGNQKPQPDNRQTAQVTANDSTQSAPDVHAIKASDHVKPKTVVPRQAKFVAAAGAAPKAESVKLLPGERSYLQAIARLDSTIKSNQKSMRPSLQVEYERNLAVVDRAIAATRSAAKSNPNDPDAADFMFAAYQSKVDLLNTIADARVGGGRGH